MPTRIEYCWPGLPAAMLRKSDQKGKNVKKTPTVLCALSGMLTVIVPVVAFSAVPAMAISPIPLCSSPGTALSGSYKSLTITGNEYVANNGVLTVSGNVTLAPGACLDAFSMGTVNVGGNVFVGNGSTLALGCSLTAAIISPTPCTGSTDDTVAGNVIANQPWTMYLTADTIGGNVVSNGGGPGPGQPYVQFPTKENNIRGNLIIQGWEGGWSGAIRNHVGGNLIYSKNVSVLDTDSNEVVTNTINGNLICQGNSPAVQFGDSGGLLNTVGGHKLGQCASL